MKQNTGSAKRKDVMIHMIVEKIAKSGNDEYTTPEYAIEPIIKYLPTPSYDNPIRIWCPFDKGDSNYVNLLKQHGYTVLHSHIEDGKDFFKVRPTHFDIIISNPPYSRKGDVLQRLFDIGKPFAMLVGVVGLFESKQRFEMFSKNDFEIMYFDKRVSFYTENGSLTNPPFSSVYISVKTYYQSRLFLKE